MDGGVWQATDHAVTKSQTRLSDFIFTLDIHKEGGTDGQEDSDLYPALRKLTV